MDSPDGKRRILNLIRASGMIKHLTELEPHVAIENDLLRFHTREYVEHVKKVSDAYRG